MIDYLQLMNASGAKFNSRQEEVSTISRSLKGLAKELDIPIIALSQLSRAVEQRPGEQGKVPQLSDLRESGAIEQDADIVIFVHRPEYYHILEDSQGNSLKGMAQICIAKHRKGATKDVTLSFKSEYTRFANPDEFDSYSVSGPTDGSFRGSRMNGDIINDDPLDGSPMTGSYSNDVPY
jgi:replicative DNA helicase